MTDREQYERDLAERQRQHLEQVSGGYSRWRPCMHDACAECVGTGINRFGGACVHGISCPCPKCNTFSMSWGAFTGTAVQAP
jgi:hypothetical protein